ncbi:aldo/keto reductase [Thermostichus vulcanus]|uniref:Aldo/keto reductase n=1 Tax=Thermostichus vulcanus str. 'Rupite' TaxID=2813851 RepID=A0ABT0CD67_THEVL|nr:aldo/keto reductase [Thermostichus vulcanus]MCJ2543703.1 aldo/keto reductase [Thermostichus vulcanus str. 'Rupite']
MQSINLGKTGLKVFVAPQRLCDRRCLGTMTDGNKQGRDWVLMEAESCPFFQAALGAGINFFDTADRYSLGMKEE